MRFERNMDYGKVGSTPPASHRNLNLPIRRGMLTKSDVSPKLHPSDGTVTP
jgi:hypothetical protein